MKTLLFITLASVSIHSFAQRTVDVSKDSYNQTRDFYVVGGTPFVNTRFVSLVEGTPYFTEDWLKGSVTDRTGNVYKDLKLKLDLYGNELHYEDKQGNEMITATPLKDVVLYDNNNQAFHFVMSDAIASSGLKSGYYLDLVDSGAVHLFKHFHKELTESRPYSSATVEQRIITTNEYYLVRGNEVIPVKKIKDVPGILSDKRSILEDFLKNKDNRERSMDDRMAALINFYNTPVQDTGK